MKNLRWMSLALAALALAAFGCSSPPDEEIEAARAAIDQARTAEAEAYATEAWQSAQDSMASLEAELAAQEEKFGLFRSYDTAREQAAQVKANADRAVTEAESGRQRVQVETTDAISQARTRLEATRTALDTAPAGKGTAADLAALRGDLDSAEQALAEAEAAMSEGRYRDAQAKAEAVLSTLDSIDAEISNASGMTGAAQRRS